MDGLSVKIGKFWQLHADLLTLISRDGSELDDIRKLDAALSALRTDIENHSPASDGERIERIEFFADLIRDFNAEENRTVDRLLDLICRDARDCACRPYGSGQAPRAANA